MNIAVFGSFNPGSGTTPSLKGNQDVFEKACYEIGYEIGRRGHTLFIASYNPSTADYQLTQGVLKASIEHGTSPRVEVCKEINQIGLFEADSVKYPKILNFKHWVSDDATIAQLYAIRDADVVLVIGGNDGAFRAATAALIAGKRVVPVSSFGGAALGILDVLTTLSVESNLRTLDKKTLGVLRNPWSRSQLEVTVNALGLNDFPKIMVIHGRSKDWQQLVDFLVSTLNLPSPIVMGQEFGNGKTLPAKYEDLAVRVDGAIALATPDDIGAATLDPSGMPLFETSLQHKSRARQNVWLEVGWFWGSLGISKLISLRRGSVEIPSDLQGLEDYEYATSPLECAKAIKHFIDNLKSN